MILIVIEIRHYFVEYLHDIKKQIIKFENFTVENKIFLNYNTSKYKSLIIII